LFIPVIGNTIFDPIIPPQFRDAADGSILETSPPSVAILRALAARLLEQGGAAIVIDYGYAGPAIGDTLQAVRGHAYVNPFEDPGEADLTAHVDFGTLIEAARVEGLEAYGPVSQGAWLRAEALSRAAPDRAADVAIARDRLIGDDAMGELFKVVALTAPGWPIPAGFAE
jgi:SAM-dependent MidA family methyltransferase